jgi:hypothetical protein
MSTTSGLTDAVVTVMVETPGGLLVRTIESATPLRDDMSRGKAAEDATRGAASVWGLPDFVYRAAVVPKQTGSREVGDGLLIVGDLAIVVQVKTRDAVTTDEEKERRWLEKHTSKGLRQAYGTIRHLRQTKVPLTNGRGRSSEVDGRALRWIAVVVVEHSRAPEDVVIPVNDTPHPSVVLLRRDWEFLFDQLKSSHAVSRYLERVAGESIALGEEIVRYFQLAHADAAAESKPSGSDILGPRGKQCPDPSCHSRSLRARKTRTRTCYSE